MQKVIVERGKVSYIELSPEEEAAHLAEMAAHQPTAEQLAREAEIRQAPLTARDYFAAHPAAIAFIRLTPAEQEAAIEGYTLAQLKAVIKYLTIAVSALVKREYLE